MDADHILLCSPIHSADRKDDHRDQAAQHQPRAHSFHAHPCGRCSVMVAHSGPNRTAVTHETITKDLCNRLEAEGRRALSTRRGVKHCTQKRPMSWQIRHPMVSTWQARCPSALTAPTTWFSKSVTCVSFRTPPSFAGLKACKSVGGRALCAPTPVLSKYDACAGCSAEWQVDSELCNLSLHCTPLPLYSLS